MTHLQIILPAALLALAFVLKLCIDREATAPVLIQALLELPVDMTFLSSTFIISYTIGTNGDKELGLILFIAYLIGTILVILLWRRSIRFFDSDRLTASSLLGMLNYLISVSAIVLSVNLVIAP